MNVLVVDDHPLFRLGVKTFVSEIPKLQVTEASNGNEALLLLQKNIFDIAILDIDMPLLNGIELSRIIRQQFPQTKIIFLTAHANIYTFAEALEIDFEGFIFKENAQDETAECINSIVRNEKFISKTCQDFINNHFKKLEKIKTLKKQLNLLTVREKQVLQLIAKGKSTPLIAEELYNSVKTIENHRTNICNKLGLKGANNLMIFALENREIIEKFSSNK